MMTFFDNFPKKSYDFFCTIQLPAAYVSARAVPDFSGRLRARQRVGGDGACHHLLPGRVSGMHPAHRGGRWRHQSHLQPFGRGGNLVPNQQGSGRTVYQGETALSSPIFQV